MLKITLFSPAVAQCVTESDEKPEFIDMNKLEQKQQAFDNSVAVIQPFQPLEDQREQIKKKIQQIIQTTKCTLHNFDPWQD